MSIKISFQLSDILSKEFKFESFEELEKFIGDEVNYWEEQKKQVKGANQPEHELFNISTKYSRFLNEAKSWLQENADKLNEFNNQLDRLQRQHLSDIGQHWLWSGHGFNTAFINSNKLSRKTADAFFNVIKNKTIRNANDFDNLQGAIIAFEYLLKDNSEISSKYQSEFDSFNHLKAQIEQIRAELHRKNEKFSDDWNNWRTTTIEQYTSWKQGVESESNNKSDQNQKTFDEFIESSKTKISELEKTYEEKLRLKKPARYWRKKVQEYKCHGIIYTVILVIILILGILGFGDLLRKWVTAQSIGLELKTIQGAAIFISVLSIFAFLIKVFSRLAFSSFHLQRDAEEREQLTPFSTFQEFLK
ncbi:DUF6161 domain-containing protein [Legionella pneumophila]|uniref:DUF6161 domain-containing protein n=3 Tax=Legionella pneumophila TaxID=446 RepID=UPI0007708340|nr:DUF6161 domain-containing protein [Legionella pneumophila]PYB42258.1 hypothetical protein DM454_16105 [Legionella pneumophila]PYB60764.1 hypothetical protein DM455_12590 [Legionella pneumophila]TID59159.1 hypothetical protein DIZ40_09390 [Legionella pneumophila]TID64241.1 hypothetical protein DIZ43_16105 [Legionella pneumophila]TID74102.1 hypothetical protein DIZ55_12710 [Legionella pneumophila]